MDKKIISFEISKQLDEKLRTAAYTKNVTKSALIRSLLEEALTKEKTDGTTSDRSN